LRRWGNDHRNRRPISVAVPVSFNPKLSDFQVYRRYKENAEPL